ncbi:50S ribosomal protein L15 [[Mycoplasma] mobile]|uniref:Large ribosomal subunit protein uL15 n=1 Tax=Mycoplasma mobile (strain ATCC 43663 / 163K / NCTC 11711) TaxID=267748 RepID=RL15_MYCM1|nr:50S ribosomal protein L15 [[Mycoplasma] mobile]Q6KI37.1 RecName: Full=Large ribosomal subunit protein uL15; AltName: Full=50S ribosomal protein L15 [Mycoplasma mobile 163K]AAT27739.1 50S ribosomal protein l15 [Mycoplasma mobile 163K]
MNLHELKYNEGARKEKHRVGRGHAAGKGKQAGKGQSGQLKRTGSKPGFEGGQNPWYRRVPKRGFNNVNHIEYQVISIETLDAAFPDKAEINPEVLHEKRIARNKNLPIKLLANGATKKKFTIKLNAASKKAIELIEKAGGKVEVI